MQIGGTAHSLVHVRTEIELVDAIEYAEKNELHIKMIGHGSNIIWSGDFDGLIIVNEIMGFTVEDTMLTIGAGENWDTVVKSSVDIGLTGIEYLSLIPGTAGATPVQNVGAYGAEIADTLVSIRAYDSEEFRFVELTNEECEFGYRKSRFNTHDKDRFYITSISLKLSKGNPMPPFYKALEEYLDEHSITDYSPKNIRDAVIAIRESKLPDPKQVANCGSFFKNPIITKSQYITLHKQYESMPSWDVESGVKIPAAWLLEQAGFTNYKDEKTGMGTYEKHPLVIVNFSANSVNDLQDFIQKIKNTVHDNFGIDLEVEPEIVGNV